MAAGTLAFVSSCDRFAEEIDVADRLVEVELPVTDRSVLVEEFSGQLCTNCPDGAVELENIQHAYEPGKVIVVSLHCGVAERLGVHESNGGLATDFGESVFSANGRPAQPSAVVDRYTGVISQPQWLTYISTSLTRSTPLSLAIENDYNPVDSMITIKIKGQSSLDLDGNLNVWITEDNIVAPQRLVSGGYNYEHVFNHIFRTSLTPLAGNPVSFAWDAEEPAEYEFTVKQSKAWKAENLTVVAFVDNASGVCQAAKAPVVLPVVE